MFIDVLAVALANILIALILVLGLVTAPIAVKFINAVKEDFNETDS